MAKFVEIIKNIFINPRKAFTTIASNNYLKEGIFIFIFVSLFKIIKIKWLIPEAISAQLFGQFSRLMSLPLNIQTFIITPLYNIGALIFTIVAIKLIADVLNRNIRHGLKSFFVALCFMQSIEFLTGMSQIIVANFTGSYSVCLIIEVIRATWFIILVFIAILVIHKCSIGKSILATFLLLLANRYIYYLLFDNVLFIIKNTTNLLQ